MEKSAMLPEHVIGLSGLAVGIVLALVEAGRVKVPEVRRMLKLVYGYVAIIHTPEAARPIAHADALLAGYESSGRDVRQTLSLSLAFLLRERPGQREALLSWLSYATPEEIQEELLELLRAPTGTNPMPPDAP